MKHILSIITFILMFTSIHASDGNTLLLKEGGQAYKSQRNVTLNGDTVLHDNKVSVYKSE